MRIAICIIDAMVSGFLLAYFMGPVGVMASVPVGLAWGLLAAIWQESAR